MQPITVRELHRRAMELSTLSDMERMHIDGTPTTARALLRAAAILEERAAGIVDDLNQPLVDRQPTLGVLYRSAAWLYHNAGIYKQAAHLARRGLETDPPDKIAVELRDVLSACQYAEEVANADR